MEMMSTHTDTQKLHEIKRIRANFGKLILGKKSKNRYPLQLKIGEYARKKIRNDYKQKVNNYSFDGKNSNLFFSFSDVRMLWTPRVRLCPVLPDPAPGGSAGRPL